MTLTNSLMVARANVSVWLSTGDSVTGRITDVIGNLFCLSYRDCNPQWINMDHVVRIMELKQ
jgi:hypothetical protein